MLVRHSVGVGAEEVDAVIEALGESVEGIVQDSGSTIIEAMVEDSDDEMASIVEDTFCDDWDTASGADVACRDKKLEPLVNFRRVKTSVSVNRPKVIHDFDLNEPSAEEKALAAKYKGERDFDLNKLPIAGDKKVLFADKVLKFTGSGKMKRRILLITDFAIYIVDPETEALKRRIALAAVEKMLLSELSDNFFSIIIPTEYDLLMASTRKTEIVDVLVEATKSELEVVFSNSFEYHAAAELVKEVHFEQVEGGVKTRIARK